MASDVTIMRMFGLGLTLAVLMDASLVRMLLVPSFMHLLGRANWWAPRRIAQWHARFGLTEEQIEKRSRARILVANRREGRHRMPREPMRRER